MPMAAVRIAIPEAESLEDWFAEVKESFSREDAERFSELISRVDDLYDLREFLREKGKHVLHYAAMLGSVEMVDTLIQNGADLNTKSGEIRCLEKVLNEATPLHCAAMSGRVEIVKFLIDQYAADVKSRDKEKATPLHYAVMQKGNLDVVKFLVEKRAEIDCKDSEDATPLHYAAKQKENQDVVKFLVENGANCDAIPLHDAAKQKGNLDVVKLLVEKGAEIDRKDSEDATPLHYAAKQKGNLDVVKFLVEKGANVDCKDSYDATPLHNAVLVKDNLEIVEYLVGKGAEINNKDDDEYTPVYKAARWGHNEVVILLVEHSAKQDVGTLIADAVNAIFSRLDCAIQQDEDLKDSFRRCMTLITEFEQKKGWSTANSFTGGSTIALHHAAKAGSTEMVEAMIKLGVDVNITSEWMVDKGDVSEDRKQTTPLHVAADRGHLEVVKLLVKSHANIHHRGYKMRTPLHRACYSGHPKTASYLLESGADPIELDRHGNNCLHLAIRANQSEMAALLLDNEKWKEMLETSSDDVHPQLQMPLSILIVKMPNVAELALSKCVVTNEGQKKQHTDKVHPTSKDFKVTYDYTLLEKCSSRSPRKCCSDGGKVTFERDTHPLFLIMKSNHPKLLKHPLVTSLLKSKWDSFGRKMLFTNLSLYVLFLTFLTAFGLVSPSPLEPTCERALNGSFNESQPDSCGGLSTVDYYFLYLAAGITTALAVLRLAMEVIQLITHPVKYLLDWVNWVEIPLYLCSIIFAFVFATPCLCVYHWQWRFGVISIFLGWIALITFLQKWPLTGVYFLAFVHIFRSYLKVALLALLLIIAFGLSFYLLFFEPGEMRNAFSHPGRALVKVMAMTIGELDYDNVFHQKEGEMEITFPAVSFLLWIVFIVSMPLLLNNYLTGLAVGDVNEVLSIAKETEIKLQIDLILSIEEILQCLKISHWFPEVYDENKKRVVFINDPEKMIPKCCANAPEFIKRRYRKWHISDRFFKTGQQIAEAIKPQPLPLELEHLKQQSKEQAQLLEVKLKKQSEDQSEQLQQVAENLHLKIQREVASMKATVEEVLKKLDRL